MDQPIRIRVAAMLAVQQIADMERLTLGDHLLFINLLPVVEQAIRSVLEAETDIIRQHIQDLDESGPVET